MSERHTETQTPKRHWAGILQVAIIGLMTAGLIGVSYFNMRQPATRENQKALAAAQFWLEALGKSKPEELGKELHPLPRRRLNPTALTRYLQALGLSKGVTVANWPTAQALGQEPEWRWLLQASSPEVTQPFPLLVSLRLPEEMSLSRRIRVYGLCRPDLELKERLQQLLKPAEQGAVTGFVSNQEKQLRQHWQQAPPKNLQLEAFQLKQGGWLEAQTTGPAPLRLRWQVVLGKDALKCDYQLASWGKRTNSDTAEVASSTMNKKQGGSL